MCFDSEGSLGGVVCLRSVEINEIRRRVSDQGENSDRDGDCVKLQLHCDTADESRNDTQLINAGVFGFGA